jgi:hypothetical protein
MIETEYFSLLLKYQPRASPVAPPGPIRRWLPTSCARSDEWCGCESSQPPPPMCFATAVLRRFHCTVNRPATSTPAMMYRTHVGGPLPVCSSPRCGASPLPILTKARLPASTVASAAVSVLAFATSREERIPQPAETNHDETQSYIVTQDIGVPHDAHNTVVSLTRPAPPPVASTPL